MARLYELYGCIKMEWNEIGIRIMQLRDERGKSQEDVAKGIGESRETVRNWEVGTRKIKAESIIKLSKYFGVTSDYLLGLGDVKAVNYDIQVACMTTGLSESAVQYLHEINDTNNSRSYIFGYSDIISGLLTTRKMTSVLSHFKVALALQDAATQYEQEDHPELDNLKVDDLLKAEEIVQLGGEVTLPFEDAIKFYLQEAVNLFKEILEYEIENNSRKYRKHRE